MRFLSIRQPWAALILTGKDIENRTWTCQVIQWIWSANSVLTFAPI
jgi:hypothetical protein